jgi:hypothetical protein
MSKKNTLPIVYHAGSYGTYLEWCLTTLTLDIDITSPLTKKGNSHNFKGNHLINIEGWNQYVESDNQFQFVRFHPKVAQTDDLHKILNTLSGQVNFFVYIYPDKNTLLLSLNNQFNKVWEDWWTHAFQSKSIDIKKIYDNWPINHDTPVDEIPYWIRREFLSYYMMPMYFDQIEWHKKAHYNQPNCIFVTIDDLLYNFQNVILRIANQTKITLLRPVDVLESHHIQMLECQAHANQDFLVKEIVNSIVNEVEFDWPHCSVGLATESYLQWELRNRGFEMRCDGLDIFPTNSVQLKELLYPV